MTLTRDQMRYLGYALAIVVGAVGLIGGITSGSGLVAGAAVGWLIASVINIIYKQGATVTGEDEAVFSVFTVPWWLGLIDVGLIVVGAIVGFAIKH
jgi:hypothetical protein